LNLSSSSILAKSFKSETKRDPFMSQQSLLILKNPKKETEKKANMVSIIRRQKEREPAKAETARNRALFSSSSSSSSSCLVPVTACDLQV
jgi:hypothetical protein